MHISLLRPVTNTVAGGSGRPRPGRSGANAPTHLPRAYAIHLTLAAYRSLVAGIAVERERERRL